MFWIDARKKNSSILSTRFISDAQSRFAISFQYFMGNLSSDQSSWLDKAPREEHVFLKKSMKKFKLIRFFYSTCIED